MNPNNIDFDSLQDDSKNRLNFSEPLATNASLPAFAAANGLSFTASADIAQESSTVIHNPYYGLTRNRVLLDIIGGQVNSLRYRLFRYCFVAGGGKTTRRCTAQFAVIDLPSKVPHISLTSRRYSGNALVTTQRFNSGQELNVEPEINAAFKVESPAATAQIADQLLCPPVVQALEKFAADYVIEFIDNKVYLYAPGFDGSKASYEQLYTSVMELSAVLAPVLPSLPALAADAPRLATYDFWKNNAIGFVVIAAFFIVAMIVAGLIMAR